MVNIIGNDKAFERDHDSFHAKPWTQDNWDIIDLNWVIVTTGNQEKILDTVDVLPIVKYKEKIAKAVSENRVVIIQAETWSGKTTQIAKILHEQIKKEKQWSSIVITEPRRLAAAWSAERVSQEMLALTKNIEYTLGYKIGYKTWKSSNSSDKSEILFVTELLQTLRMIISGKIPDILIIDEVHTLWENLEFLLAHVLRLMEKAWIDLKIVLASATMDVDKVKKCFSHLQENEIPVFDLPWRTFPVEKHYRKWDEFMSSIIEWVEKYWHTLVFVEWKKPIYSNIEALKKLKPDWNILPLHSELSIKEQNLVLEDPTKPTVIIATNIAETSITIPYIKCVVDNGYCNRMEYDNNWIPILKKALISKAESWQRAGRAGRVSEWVYIRCNDTPYEEIPDFPESEISRTLAEKNNLISLQYGFSPLDEIRKREKENNEISVFLNKPNKRLFKLGYNNLTKIWAITKDNNVTEIGRDLLHLPLDPRVWRILLEWIEKWCVGDMIEICAIINQKWFLSKDEKWKIFMKTKFNKKKNPKIVGDFNDTSDLIVQRELLRFLISTDLISNTDCNNLLALWIDKNELSEYQKQVKNCNIYNKRLICYYAINFKLEKYWVTKSFLDKIWEDRMYLDFDLEIELDYVFSKIREIWINIPKIDDYRELIEILMKDKNLLNGLSQIDAIQDWDSYSVKFFLGKMRVKPIFEMISFDSLWVKQKRIYEIVDTINILKERIEELNWKPISDKDTNKDVNKIITCIATGLFHIFKWDSSQNKFWNEDLWFFRKPNNSTIEPFNRDRYIGDPFGIWWNGEKDDMFLLSFITRIDDQIYNEIIHRDIVCEFKNVNFWEKEFSEEIDIIKDAWRMNLSSLARELLESERKYVLSYVWLPNFLIENNQSIIKFIKTNKHKWKVFNLTAFKNIIKLFTPMLYDRFYIDNIDKSLHSFIYDTRLMQEMIQSQDLRVKEFLNDPYKKKYDWVIEEENLAHAEMKKDVVLEKKQAQIIHKEWTIVNSATNNNEWEVDLIEYVFSNTKFSRNKIKDLIKVGWVTVDWILIELSQDINPNEQTIKIDTRKLKYIKVIRRRELLLKRPLTMRERMDIISGLLKDK